MSFRRFVHLVTNDPSSTYSLRRVDMSRFFRPPRPLVHGVKAGADDPAAVEDGCLPAPTLSFYAPNKEHLKGQMDFFLLKSNEEDVEEEEEGNKVVATDHTGRSVLYDLDLHAVRALPSLTAPKYRPISLTVGKSLYVFDRIPKQCSGRDRQSFEALTFHQPRCEYGDWSWRSLHPPPFVHDPRYESSYGPSGHIDSYAVVAGSNVCISTRCAGTYSFDTKSREWTKYGNWALPFRGLAEYVPEHKLWFGISSDDVGNNTFCASNLDAASMLTPPGVHSLWKDITPPMEGNSLGSYAVHLGSSKFCIVRFLEVVTSHACEKSRQFYESEEIFVVFTGVEVERSGEVLHAVKHKSERYKLADDQMAFWVF